MQLATFIFCANCCKFKPDESVSKSHIYRSIPPIVRPVTYGTELLFTEESNKNPTNVVQVSNAQQDSVTSEEGHEGMDF